MLNIVKYSTKYLIDQESCKLDRNKREYAFSDSLITLINDYAI